MKILTCLKYSPLFFITAAVLLSACSSVTNDVEAISDEDVSMAAEIVGSSLADDQSGLMASMYDAFSNIDDSGIEYGHDPRLKVPDDQGHRRPGRRGGRGGEQNFTHSYDSATGTHYLSYERSFENDEVSNSVSVNQEIIFTGIDGNFLAEPRPDRDSIETIDFIGSRVGEHEGPFRSSDFTKIDTMYITGVHATSSVLSLSGTHYGAGNAEGMKRDSTFTSRSYQIHIEFTDVEVVKDTVEAYGSLENGVSGTLSYTIEMNETTDGVPEESIVEGTIDLEEDGTALMRFNKLPQVIRFSLVDGARDDRPGDRGRNPRRD